jgi:hypothetical protein
MIKCGHLFSGLIVLFVFLSAAACSSCRNTPVPLEAETASKAGEIVIEKYASDAPEDCSRAILNRVQQNFALLDYVFYKRGEYGRVANYLSRFYAHTDIFHKAKRYDSFILAYHPDTKDERKNVRCAVDIFTYDSNSPVKQIRRLENMDTTSLRKRPMGGSPGSLTFKAGTEYYRIFFSDKRVIFFFSYSPRPDAPDVKDDPALYAAALKLKECLTDSE